MPPDKPIAGACGAAEPERGADMSGGAAGHRARARQSGSGAGSLDEVVKVLGTHLATALKWIPFRGGGQALICDAAPNRYRKLRSWPEVGREAPGRRAIVATDELSPHPSIARLSARRP